MIGFKSLDFPSARTILRLLLPFGSGERFSMRRYFLLCSIAAVSLFAFGCTTPTGAKTELSRNQVQSIKSLGVVAKADKPFDVRFSRDEAGSAGAMVGAFTFGLSGVVVGSTIEAGAKYAADNSKRKSLTEQTGVFDPVTLMRDDLVRRLSAAKTFETVSASSTNAASADATDGTLSVTLREWGLRRHQAGGTNELLQVAFDANVRLARKGGALIWERNDVYLDGHGHSLREFKETPGLLVDRISVGLSNYVGRVANELRYAK